MHLGFSENYIKMLLALGQKLLDGASFSDMYADELMDNAKVFLFWKDNFSNFIACNMKFAALGGITNPHLIIGINDYDLPWHKEESDLFRRDDQQVFNFGKPKINMEESLHQCDDQQLSVLTSKIPIYSSNNKKSGLIGIATDITEQKFLEKKILETNNIILNNLDILSNIDNGYIYGSAERLTKISEHLKNNQNSRYVCLYKEKQIRLSARQLQCLGLIIHGKTNKQIAKYLHLSPRTIDYYLNIIREKFGCANKNDLIDIILSSKGFIDCSIQRNNLT